MHLLVIVGIALLIFGPKKLPELGKGLGDGIRGFKSAINGEDRSPVTDVAEAVAPRDSATPASIAKS
ncbi:MAG: twin-arginine translocase TatA/TatE family subunit [Terriglobales bacterium]